MKRLFLLLCLLFNVAQIDAATVPHTFANRAGTIPLKELDEDFAAFQASGGGDLVSFTQSGTGAQLQTMQTKAQQLISVFDFMTTAQIADVTTRTASLNVTTAINNAINRAAALGGGIVLLPRGTYLITGSQIIVSANVWLRGENGVSTYDTVSLFGGTVIKALTGDWAFHLVQRQSRLSNMVITGDTGTTEYCVVVSVPNTIVDGVTCHKFPYGFVGAGWNSNIFYNITALLCTKIGFASLPSNTGGTGAYAYPKINGIIGTTPTTTFSILNSKFESNKIGIALLSGYGVFIQNTVSESNDYYGVLIFKRTGTTNNITFDNFWMEADATVATPWSISGIEALKTSSTEYLKNSSGVQWVSADDAGFGWWLGAVDETYGVNSSFGGPWYVTIRNSVSIPNQSIFRLRSQQYMRVERSVVATNSVGDAVSATANSYKLKIVNPSAQAMAAQFAAYTVPGTLTLYEFDDAPKKAVAQATIDSVWLDVVDVALMSSGQRYGYSISATSQWADYGQQGYVFYDGTSVQLVKQFPQSATLSDVRISGTKLQYRQTSGGGLNVSWKIYPGGPVEQISLLDFKQYTPANGERYTQAA